ncbi:hypothetical protein P691DRAFT_767625 [Macrolepiota fuliginosa MF-IS2]|uniref:Uncharacterized protein n=1 Tax=Macrolepiota fuliginosa MF-IS2 TaxID=1400762 RepID=A0A9P6BUQ9_9AGAR|nr:hypothetical protein P691DRAFT_767625 [Macrolepiota fuliginosa MF-IS2]
MSNKPPRKFPPSTSFLQHPLPLACLLTHPVPKKSKLRLLSVRQKGKDLSDIIRCVDADSSSTHGGFEIYVDCTNDLELGDIVVVKKQKSLGALAGMSWGALEEVTNVPNAPKNGSAPSHGV